MFTTPFVGVPTAVELIEKPPTAGGGAGTGGAGRGSELATHAPLTHSHQLSVLFS